MIRDVAGWRRTIEEMATGNGDTWLSMRGSRTRGADLTSLIRYLGSDRCVDVEPTRAATTSIRMEENVKLLCMGA